MRNLFVLLLLLLIGVQAFAAPKRASQTVTPAEDKPEKGGDEVPQPTAIGELRYQVPAQHLELIPRIAVPVMGDRRDLDNTTQLRTQHFRRNAFSSLELDLAAEYGIADRFSVGLSEGFLYNEILTNDIGDNPAQRIQIWTAGFSNPSASARYRYVSGMLAGDAVLVFTPAILDTWLSTDTAPGSTSPFDLQENRLGQSLFRFGTDLYIKACPSSEIGISPYARVATSGSFMQDTKVPGTTVDQVLRGNWDTFANVSLDLNYRHHVDPIYGQVGFMSETPFTRTARGLTTTTTTAAGTAMIQSNQTIDYNITWKFTPKFILGYQFSPRTALDLTLLYDWYGWTANTKDVNGNVLSSSHVDLSEMGLALAFRKEI